MMWQCAEILITCVLFSLFAATFIDSAYEAVEMIVKMFDGLPQCWNADSLHCFE